MATNFSAPKRRSLPTPTGVQDQSSTLAAWQSQLNPLVANVAPQPTPSNFSVTNARGGLQLSWAPVNGATGYEILKSQNGSFTDDLAVIPISGASNTSHFDSLGGASQTAHYRIRTIAGDARGPESGVVSHTSLDSADSASTPTTVKDKFTNDKVRSLARLGNYGAIQSTSSAGNLTGTNGASNPASSVTPTGGPPSVPAISFGLLASGTNTSAQMTVAQNAEIIPDPNLPGVISATHAQGTLISTATPADGSILAFSATDGQYDLPTNVFVNPSGSGNIIPAAANTAQSLGSTAAPWNGVFRQINNVMFADAFPGSDAGQKIANAIAALPSTGGVVDARGLTGPQTISSGLTIGTSTQPVTVLVGATTYACSASITMGYGSGIIGPSFGSTVFIWSANVEGIVTAAGAFSHNVTLQNLDLRVTGLGFTSATKALLHFKDSGRGLLRNVIVSHEATVAAAAIRFEATAAGSGVGTWQWSLENVTVQRLSANQGAPSATGQIGIDMVGNSGVYEGSIDIFTVQNLWVENQTVGVSISIGNGNKFLSGFLLLNGTNLVVAGDGTVNSNNNYFNLRLNQYVTQHFSIDANSNFNMLAGSMEAGTAYSDSGGGNTKLLSTGFFGGLYDITNNQLTTTAAVKVAGSASLPTAAGTNLLLAGNLGSPVSGRIYAGDGTGWKLGIAKRTGSVDTDLVIFRDNGNVDLNKGSITTYNGISTVGNGVPIVVARTDLTNFTTAISATTIYAVPSSGLGVYEVSFSASITTAASSSCSLGGSAGFRLKFTDGSDNVVKTTAAPTITSSSNSTGTHICGTFTAYCSASTNLQYLFDYTSSGATPMAYDLHVIVKFLG